MTEFRFRGNVVLIAFAFLLIPSLTFAQSPPPAITGGGALAIERGLTAWLRDRVEGHASVREFVFEDVIVVRREINRYRAIIPAGRVVLDDGGESIAFGTTVIALTPIEGGALEAAWLLPSRFEIRGIDDAEPLVFTVGDQSGRGVFLPELGTFLDLALVLSDVTGTVKGKAGAFSAASIGFSIGSEIVGPGAFESRGGVTVSDLRLAGAPEVGGLSIGSIRLDSVLTGLRLAGFMALAQSFLSPGRDAAAGESLKSFYDMADALVRSEESVVTGGAVSFTIEDLAINAAGTRFSFERANISTALDGVDDDSAFAFLGLELAGVASSWFPAALDGIVPNIVTVDIDMVNLPNDAMRRTLLSFIQTSRNMGPYIAARLTPLEFKTALMRSNARMVVNELRLAADLVDVRVRGSVQTARNLPLGLSVSAHIEVAGLPELMEAISDRSRNSAMTRFLTIVQAIGQQATDDDGRRMRTYEVELGGDLSFFVNGTDIRPLMGDFLPQ